ncbi:SpoIIE family protein phosphatase [Mangrovibacterium marinum]|uniref:SpoIIE family protein phosphatase n=1 Tax=Mangrovibacterium marinum TaxID=1639118 RepID=UPI002A18C43F|nr:SpoIIE family protein phosphatase [Mangrovibacterium marinum]
MNNRSIAFQLSLYIVVIVTITVGVIVYLNYNYSKRILIEKIEENAINKSVEVQNKISFYVVSTQEITRNASHQILFYSQQKSLEDFLGNVLRDNPILSGFRVEFAQAGQQRYLSLFNKAGTVEIFHSPEYCNFPNYNSIKGFVSKQTDGLWSTPFYCPLDTTLLVASYTCPIHQEDGTVVGYLSTQINLNFLNQINSNLKIDEGAMSFILGEDGTFLAHPDSSMIMNKNIYELSEKILSPSQRLDYEALMRAHQQGSGFARPEALNYEKAWFHFAPVPKTYWTVLIVIPARQLFSELDGLFRNVVIISLVCLIVIIGIIFLLFRRMLSPLAAIAKSIKRVSSGELLVTTQKNEIDLLSSSLHDLQQNYSKHLNEQTQSKKDKRKIEKDLKSAKEIQTAIIPTEFIKDPRRPEIDLYAILDPAESIGGDLYDYFYVDSNHLLFTMGDVSGKGIPAALFMAVAHTLIKGKSKGLKASQIVEKVNDELSLQNSNQNFLTLFLGILDVETGELSYCNAAHNYPYVITRGGKVHALDKTHGLPIGVYSSKSYGGDTGILKAGDRLVLYTDGVTDCRNEQDELFGIENLRNCIADMPDLPAKASTQYILDCLRAFKGNAARSDDISLMIIDYKRS